MQTDEVVLSDVHVETCPPLPPGTTWSTRFRFNLDDGRDIGDHHTAKAVSSAAGAATAQDSPEVDSDGDVVLPNRPRYGYCLTLQHALSTTISCCGQQIWPGACLLADWVLAHQQQLHDAVVVELGAGVGLVSLLASFFAQTVFLTDVDAGALQLAQHNAASAAAATSLLRNTSAPGLPASAISVERGSQAQCTDRSERGCVHVRVLDWQALAGSQLQQLHGSELLQLLNSTQPKQSLTNHQQQQQRQKEKEEQEEAAPHPVISQWCADDLQQLAATSCWLAADVVFDDILTDAFMHAAAALLRWQQQQQQQQEGPHAHDPQQHTCTPPPHHQQQGDGNNATVAAAAAAAAGGACPTRRPKLVVALEKRYNFTLRDMDASAPAFEHFMAYVQPSGDSLVELPDGEQQRVALRQQQQQQLFLGNRLEPAAVPQALQYDRSEHLELWELSLLPDEQQGRAAAGGSH